MKRLYKNYFVHNVIAHPLMQIFSMLGCDRLADKIHNSTLPPLYNSLVVSEVCEQQEEKQMSEQQIANLSNFDMVASAFEAAKATFEEANAYIHENLRELCRENIAWRTTGDCKGKHLRHLRSLLMLCSEESAMSLAEDMIKRAAMEFCGLHVVQEVKDETKGR